jgi:hypothetical protein
MYAWRLRYRKVGLNVDSISVVWVIKDRGTYNVMGYYLVKQIHDFCSLARKLLSLIYTEKQIVVRML